MRLNETIETHGYFWLPERPEDKVVGFLRISETGESILELFGSLQSADGEPRKLHILGAVDKGGPVTLTDCVSTSVNRTWNSRSGELTKSTLHVGLAFIGSHFGKQVNFTALEFSVEGLREWFYWSGRPFSTTYKTLGNYSLSYERPEPIEIDIDESLRVTLSRNARHSSELHSVSISLEPLIFLESSEERSFEDLLQIASRLKNFLCLAVDKPITFTLIEGYTDGQIERGPVQIYAKFDPYSLEKQTVEVGNLLFSFDAVAENIEVLLQSWLSSYEEFEPTFNLYFSVMANRYMHLEGRFLFLVHGLESLHRRSSDDTRIPKEEFDDLVAGVLKHVPKGHRNWISGQLKYANELPLRRRLRDMTASYQRLYGTKKEREAFISKVVDTRNYYTHYDMDIESQAATDWRELARVYRNLDNLLKLHLLRLSGMGDEGIVEAVMWRESLLKEL